MCSNSRSSLAGEALTPLLLLLAALQVFAFLSSPAIAAAASSSSSSSSASKNNNNTRLQESIKEIDSCLLQSVYSFYFPELYPPTSIDTLRSSCRTQSEGFKCVKERSRNAPAIVRRGMLNLIQTRQRFHKKLCTNVNSDLSKRFVKELKCIMDKKLPTYSKIDADFAASLLEIRKRNYNDSAEELKYLCCSIINYRRAIVDNVGPECKESKAQVEEMIMSIVTNDISLLCDDEDKLTSKVCPKLEPLNAPPYKPQPGNGASATVLYLVATLGEPEEP